MSFSHDVAWDSLVTLYISRNTSSLNQSGKLEKSLFFRTKEKDSGPLFFYVNLCCSSLRWKWNFLQGLLFARKVCRNERFCTIVRYRMSGPDPRKTGSEWLPAWSLKNPSYKYHLKCLVMEFTQAPNPNPNSYPTYSTAVEFLILSLATNLIEGSAVFLYHPVGTW